MKKIVLLALVLTLAAVLPAAAQPTYQVTVTNVTANQIISPPVVVTHNLSTRLFIPGRAASAPIAALAEDADSAALLDALDGNPAVRDFAIGDGPLMPGASVTFELTANGAYPLLSAVGMLVTTNDAFFGLDSYPITGGLWRKTTDAPAWDAGSEANTESCEHIPGPPCGNPFVRVTDGAEGSIRIHPGITGGGDLSTAGYTWLNPVVSISVVRSGGN